MKRLIAMLLAVLLIIGAVAVSSVGFAESESSGSSDSVVVFRLHDPRYLKDGTVFYHDADNSGVTPIVNSDRTLIPLRSISEAFGADVSFENNAAVIKISGKTIIFPINESSFSVDGQTYPLDTKTIIKNDRSMVPIRALCETALGLNVDFSDGYITIYGDDKAADAKNALAAAENALGSLKYYASHSEIKSVVEKNYSNMFASYDYFYAADGAIAEEAEDSDELRVSASNSATKTAEGGMGGGGDDADYSETNTQVEGVDEADIIKTDGKFIYYMSYDGVYIVEAKDNGKMELASELSAPDNAYYRDMYVDGDRLVLVGSTDYYETYENENSDELMLGSFYGKSFTAAFVYDISDKSAPKLVKSSELEGYNVSTRKIDDLVYIITEKYVYDLDEDFIPVYRDTKANGGKATEIEANKIAIMPQITETSYLNFAVIDITDDSPANIESVFGNGGDVYMNNDSIYIASYEYDWDNNDTQTCILYFDLEGRSVIPQGSVKLPGSVINQFAMDEYNGYFRVVTTDYSGKNGSSLFIIDPSDMSVAGSVTGVAKDERVYSARFDGSTVYMVTYKQVDPLFVIDASDPANPKITGQLKVPGYSSYLHPVGDDLLLGIGRDTKDSFIINDKGQRENVGTIDDGLKLSLFKIVNGQPVELDTVKVGTSRSVYSEVTYDHKALMVDKARNNFAFSTEDYSANDYTYAAYVFHINGEKLKQEAQLIDDSGSYVYLGQERLCYIGDVIYYVVNGRIYSYNYGGDYKKLDTLILSEGDDNDYWLIEE
ncbi:MAG: beta-propeller domain-containing protein [Clostridia bacterium]|nr:beta-propeller domain-containing protein [Clostridia bacterium]